LPRSAKRRLAALGYMSGEGASVDNIRLLRDFIAWEPRRMLRERARGILLRMEAEISNPPLPAPGGAG